MNIKDNCSAAIRRAGQWYISGKGSVMASLQPVMSGSLEHSNSAGFGYSREYKGYFLADSVASTLAQGEALEDSCGNVYRIKRIEKINLAGETVYLKGSLLLEGKSDE